VTIRKASQISSLFTIKEPTLTKEITRGPERGGGKGSSELYEMEESSNVEWKKDTLGEEKEEK